MLILMGVWFTIAVLYDFHVPTIASNDTHQFWIAFSYDTVRATALVLAVILAADTILA